MKTRNKRRNIKPKFLRSSKRKNQKIKKRKKGGKSRKSQENRNF
jgi:hypothetical protein